MLGLSLAPSRSPSRQPASPASCTTQASPRGRKGRRGGRHTVCRVHPRHDGPRSRASGRAAKVPPHLWFQLYVWRDPGPQPRTSWPVRQRPATRGSVLTVDAPVAGARLKDTRNGLSVPSDPHLLKTRWPAWPATPVLVGQPADHRAAGLRRLGPAGTASPSATSSTSSSTRRYWDYLADPGLGTLEMAWERLDRQRYHPTDGPTTPRRPSTLGADAIVLSSHGGRQLDRAWAGCRLRWLPEARDVLGPDREMISHYGHRHPLRRRHRRRARAGRGQQHDGRARLPLRADGRRRARASTRRSTSSPTSSGGRCTCSACVRWPSCARTAASCWWRHDLRRAAARLHGWRRW